MPTSAVFGAWSGRISPLESSPMCRASGSAHRQVIEERLYEDDIGIFNRLLLVAQNIWGQRYIGDLIARRVQRGYDSGGWVAPDGSWDYSHLSVTLSDSMFSVRRIIGNDWGSTSLSKWSQPRASLEIDYTAYGQPDPIVGLATDPWTDFPASGAASGDGVIDFFDMPDAVVAALSNHPLTPTP